MDLEDQSFPALIYISVRPNWNDSCLSERVLWWGGWSGAHVKLCAVIWRPWILRGHQRGKQTLKHQGEGAVCQAHHLWMKEKLCLLFWTQEVQNLQLTRQERSSEHQHRIEVAIEWTSGKHQMREWVFLPRWRAHWWMWSLALEPGQRKNRNSLWASPQCCPLDLHNLQQHKIKLLKPARKPSQNTNNTTRKISQHNTPVLEVKRYPRMCF